MLSHLLNFLFLFLKDHVSIHGILPGIDILSKCLLLLAHLFFYSGLLFDQALTFACESQAPQMEQDEEHKWQRHGGVWHLTNRICQVGGSHSVEDNAHEEVDGRRDVEKEADRGASIVVSLCLHRDCLDALLQFDVASSQVMLAFKSFPPISMTRIRKAQPVEEKKSD